MVNSTTCLLSSLLPWKSGEWPSSSNKVSKTNTPFCLFGFTVDSIAHVAVCTIFLCGHIAFYALLGFSCMCESVHWSSSFIAVVYTQKINTTDSYTEKISTTNSTHRAGLPEQMRLWVYSLSRSGNGLSVFEIMLYNEHLAKFLTIKKNGKYLFMLNTFNWVCKSCVWYVYPTDTSWCECKTLKVSLLTLWMNDSVS